MATSPKEIRLYHEPDGRCPFAEWYRSLKDKKTQAFVDYRLSRIEAGTLGDYKSLGEGVFELRIHYGPGWRIYFARAGARIVLLLCGSDKSSQPQQIRNAKAYWKEYQQQMEASSHDGKTR